MAKIKKLLSMFFLVFLLPLSVNFTQPVSALIPSVDNVIMWNSGGHTILNVTVSHTPASPPTHYVNKIVIDVGGTNQSFDVAQPLGITTFITPCDVGIIEVNTSALVWAHCIVNGYNLAPYGPVQIPEFSIYAMLLALILCASFMAFVFRKTKVKSL